MKYYYVNHNEQTNGDHEVHREDCVYLPKPGNCKYLGEFQNCHEAVAEAQRAYKEADGCFYCSRSCHNS